MALDTESRPPWFDQSPPCASADPDAWFPEDHHNVDRAVLAICDACPLRAACLDYALARPGLEGVWGGTTYRQRRAIRVQGEVDTVRKSTARMPHGTPAAARRHWRAHEPLCEPCRVAANSDKQARIAARKAAGDPNPEQRSNPEQHRIDKNANRVRRDVPRFIERAAAVS